MVYHIDWEELNDPEGPEIPKFSSSYLFISVLFAKIIPCTRGKHIVYFHCVHILKLLHGRQNNITFLTLELHMSYGV